MISAQEPTGQGLSTIALAIGRTLDLSAALTANAEYSSMLYELK
jgi:hypothetical protein